MYRCLIQERRRKNKKQRTNIYIEAEAAVDEDDDEDEEEEEDGFEHDLQIDDSERANEDNRHRALDTRKQREEELDAEEIAARMKERYGRSDVRGTFRGDSEHVPQSVLIPSVNDPKLWLVGCKVNLI